MTVCPWISIRETLEAGLKGPGLQDAQLGPLLDFEVTTKCPANGHFVLFRSLTETLFIEPFAHFRCAMRLRALSEPDRSHKDCAPAFSGDLEGRSLEAVTSKDAAVRGHRLFDVGELDEIVLHPPIQRFLARWRPGDPVVYLGALWVP